MHKPFNQFEVQFLTQNLIEPRIARHSRKKDCAYPQKFCYHESQLMHAPSTLIDTTLETHRTAIVRVAVFCTLKKCLDYLPPLDPYPLVPGVRVLVPFRQTQKVGVVIEITHQSDCPIEKLKPISTVLDPEPRLSPKLLELISWTANYYHVSLAEVLQAALPANLRKESLTTSKKRTTKTQAGSAMNRSDPTVLDRPLILNPAQQQAVDAVQRSWGSFKPFLLQGVTGSGKTEVYSCLIEQALAFDQQTLILVPEIGLTPQLLDRFKNRFHVPITVYHSGLSATQRLKAWEAARKPHALGKHLLSLAPDRLYSCPLKNLVSL
jgi:primosomal protein N' (replication factor Y)